MATAPGERAIDVITTIGPASWDRDVLSALVREGVHTVRFPLSKETPEVHLDNARRLAEIAADCGRTVRTMADVPGGKPRLSNEQPLDVTAGTPFAIGLGGRAPDTDLWLDPPLLARAAELAGTDVLVGDGEQSFHVERHEGDVVHGHFTESARVERRRAFTLPGTAGEVECFTAADRKLCASIRDSFDLVALSFVRTADDVDRARRWMAGELGWRPGVVAKIETWNGAVNAREIAEVSDAVMVARGDLALHVGFENLWETEKRVLAACRAAGTRSIVATGLLDSLISSRTPTRSEAVDVAGAVEAGADALLLSAETTVGIDPLHAVRVLRRLTTKGFRAG
ncbi:pyruvate kinase [Actinacidiphila acidipaludis]|uniref:Pyruvate kinase n=1 Tax=Actinacidiphila acidipaludis TaxID=2873382 RepID=A0ABS7Q825_9ACTN|nr:pyruvate kinase [Streptomyces acidipaludis]MBY8878986.1 pyruvate kinase [Streptomyces acidipaludis]